MSTDDQDPTVPIARVPADPGPPSGPVDGAPGPGGPGGPEGPDEPGAGNRRTLVVVGVVVAALLLGGLGWWWAARDDEEPTTVTSPSPTTSSPTTSEPATTSATTTPTETATTSAPPTTTAAPAGPATAIPADLRLPGEDAGGYFPQGWAYQPCGQPVSASGASDFRRVVSEQPEDTRSQALLVFPSPDAATAYLGTLRAAAEACQGPGDPGTGDAAVQLHPLEGDWDASFMVVLSYPGEGGYGPGGEYTLVVQRGTAIAVSAGYGEWAPGYPDPDPSAVAAYREPLDQLAPELCVFTADGC
ncbi:hypothetical protein GCM10028777_12320 [Angustibacter speluncae]